MNTDATDAPTWLGGMEDHRALAGCRAKEVVKLPQVACAIATPLRVAAWDRELDRFPNREFVKFLTDGITFGFRIGYIRSVCSLVSASRNMLSADV